MWAEADGDAERRAVGAAAVGRQRDGQSARSGVPVAEDVGRLHATLEDLAKSKGIGKTYVSRTATRHRGSARAVEPAQGSDDLHLKA